MKCNGQSPNKSRVQTTLPWTLRQFQLYLQQDFNSVKPWFDLAKMLTTNSAPELSPGIAYQCPCEMNHHAAQEVQTKTCIRRIATSRVFLQHLKATIDEEVQTNCRLPEWKTEMLDASCHLQRLHILPCTSTAISRLSVSSRNLPFYGALKVNRSRSRLNPVAHLVDARTLWRTGMTSSPGKRRTDVYLKKDLCSTFPLDCFMGPRLLVARIV